MINPLLLAALVGDPTKPSPFVRDTLAPLVGGPFTVLGGDPPSNPGMRLRGQKKTGHTTESGDTVYVYRGAPNPEHTLNHEAGHVWFQRMVAPQVASQILDEMPNFKPQDAAGRYAGSNEFEYMAEIFSRALERIRAGGDFEAANKEWPGLKAMADWMMTQPPFKKES